MTYTVDTNATGSVGLQEYVNYVTSEVDLEDEDSVIASAPYLRALAENSSLLVDHVNDGLRAWANFQPGNTYSAQTFTLGSGPGFLVRANIWQAPRQGDDGWEDNLYAYGLPHDHNFSFLTVGYWGPGYATRIYEYDSSKVLGYPGEPVDLQYLESTTLPAGKIMYYRASADIHTQEYPQGFSISVNLLIDSPSVGLTNQYTFDLETGAISGYVQNSAAGRILLTELATQVGNERTVDLLGCLAAEHPQARLRWAAYESLAELTPGQAPGILARAARDSHPYVRMRAEEAGTSGVALR